MNTMKMIEKMGMYDNSNVELEMIQKMEDRRRERKMKRFDQRHGKLNVALFFEEYNGLSDDGKEEVKKFAKFDGVEKSWFAKGDTIEERIGNHKSLWVCVLKENLGEYERFGGNTRMTDGQVEFFKNNGIM